MEQQQPSSDFRYPDFLGLPRFPAFWATTVGSIKAAWIFAASPVAALVIATAAWTLPNPDVAGVLKLVAWIPIAIVIFIFVKYVWGVGWYFISIKKCLLRLRTEVLRLAGVSGPGPNGDFRFSISGIAEQSGTVQIVLDQSSSQSLQIGAILAVVATDTREEWGTVRIVQVVQGLARAEVVDRKRPEFWDSLEDQMKTNPAPPNGFHLEPSGLRRLGELLRG